uniref:Uncharacterized protein n=1 Tax=Oryza glumipatula TaxID=40148 RepID=A0A0E0B9F5_9ORYZ
MGVDGADGEARLGDALRDGEAGGATADDKVGRATNAEASETARRVCLCSALGNNREKNGAISSHGYSVGPIEWWGGVGVGAQRFTEHAQLMAALGSAGRDDNTTRASHAAAAAAAATAVSSMGAGDKQMDLELHL